MQYAKSDERAILTCTATTRRAAIHSTAKLAAGAGLFMFPASRWMETAQAQDDSVILIAGSGAHVSANPGAAVAHGVAAEAAAARGAARVQVATALAKADSDDGAIAQGALAVAPAASEDDRAAVPGSKGAPRVITPARSGGRAGGSRSGGWGMMRAGISGDRGRDRERRRKQPASLPSTGIGREQPRPLPSLLAIASTAAAAGAAILRLRGDAMPTDEAVMTVHD